MRGLLPQKTTTDQTAIGKPVARTSLFDNYILRTTLIQHDTVPINQSRFCIGKQLLPSLKSQINEQQL